MSVRVHKMWFLLLVIAIFGGLVIENVPPWQVENTAYADSDDDEDDEDDEDDGEVIDFADTKIFFEFNSTDLDLGIQIFFDAEGWEEVEVSGSGTIFEVENDGSLQEIGSTEVFTESAEPPLTESEDPTEEELAEAIAEFQARFPEGEYRFEGETVDGRRLEGTAVLSHALPAAVDLDVFGFPTIAWTPGAGGPEIVGYQAVFEFEEEDTGRVFVFSVDLPFNTTAVTVPDEFLDALEGLGGESKAEVLAIAANGNKTITEEEVAFP